VQGSAKGVVGDALLGTYFEHLAEQRNGPAGVGIVKILWREGEQGGKQMLVIFIEKGMTPPATIIFESCWLPGVQIGIDPVVDALTANAEHACNVGGRSSLVKFQHGKGAAIQPNVTGL
jgi:hypothetical protein